MAETKKEQIVKLLRNFVSSDDIAGAAVIRRDGILLASQMPTGVDSSTFAAMSATMAGSAETAMDELHKGVTDRIIVESKDIRLISVSAGIDMLLVCMTEPGAKLGLVLLEMKKLAKSIETVVDG